MLGEGLILRASGETKFYSRVFLICLPIIIPTTYFLVKYYYSFGAMGGALISIILPRLILINKEIKVIESNLRDFFPWNAMGKIFSTSIIILLPIIYLKNFSPNNFYYIIFISISYLILVFLVEIKLNIFLIDKDKIISLKNNIINYKF
jgi:hypothetical protein